MELDLTLTTAFGLEAVLKRELADLGYSQVAVQDGRLRLRGTPADVCRLNLCIRSGDRVLVELGSFEAREFEALFQGVQALPWEDWIPRDGRFPVRCRSVKSILHSEPSGQSIGKKAIVERLRTGHRCSDLAETGAEFPVEINIRNDVARVSLDTTGYGLNRRGYRGEGSRTAIAPIKETLAAGLVLLSHWRPDRPFLDPFCGTGTLLIEAAMLAQGRAAGLDREFLSESWPALPKGLWEEARDQARRSIKEEAGSPGVLLEGRDRDSSSIQAARDGARRAGVADRIYLEVGDAGESRIEAEYGCVVTNPPYGERLGDDEEGDRVADCLFRIMESHPTWSFFVLTADPRLEMRLCRKATRRRKLFNGGIECVYYQFHGPRPPWFSDKGS